MSKQRLSEQRLIEYLEKIIKKNRLRYKKWSNNNLARGLDNGSPETAIKALDAITFKIESYKEKYLKEILIMKFRCERWAVIDKKSGKELGTLGWYTNSSKKEVLQHAKNNGIKIEEGEDIKVVEEC